jgi:pyruvate/2-oxoglutarate dehydrogenase complex dihydrolipoamide acyltransferase (E2) component
LAVQVLMPALGAGRDSARVVRWLKREGELVAAGAALLEVETQMAVVEVGAPGSGVLSGVRVREGEEARVGTVLAYLLAPAARPPERPAEAPPAAKAPAGAAGSAWSAVAEQVARTWREAPHFFLFRDADASQLVVARGRRPPAVTYTDLLLRLVAVTLARHPLVNSGGNAVNVALAVAVDGGLAAPVLSGADRLELTALAARRAELVERARAGRLRPRDEAGATFTVSNLGMFGADAFLPILGEGQAATLGLGRIADRVVPVAGVPQVRPVVTLTLSCDHRRVDGAHAARFLSDLAGAIEEPAAWT